MGILILNTVEGAKWQFAFLKLRRLAKWQFKFLRLWRLAKWNLHYRD